MNITINRSAGFSRPKVFATIFVMMILGDMIFRSGSGMKTVLTWKGSSASSSSSAPPPAAPPVVVAKTPTAPPLPAEGVSNARPVIKPAPRLVPKRVSLLSDGNGELIKATSDQKDLVAVEMPPKIFPRATNVVGKAAHPPLPIAVP